jgi:hypothetical protein
MFTDVSAEHTASIFRGIEKAEEAALRKTCSDIGL